MIKKRKAQPEEGVKSGSKITEGWTAESPAAEGCGVKEAKTF